MDGVRVEAVLVVAGVIRKGGRILIAQRKDDCKREPGKWEFPGGKVEEGEKPQEALEREIMEELGIRIRAGSKLLCEICSEKKGMRIRLQAYPAEWVGGEPKALECKDFRWIGMDEMGGFEWSEADLPIIDRLKGRA